jgi:hypothetical protein
MTTTKYKSHGSFHQERKAQKKLDKLIALHGAEGFRIKQRTWTGRDKKRYIVQELVRKGSKR